ncbi:MAG: hypothetical protein JSU59_02925 [Nitrospirota bacterium]|nr:MAG: hypothetical protein JSU59_02925 [Nitrospirota bacterium]
MLVPRSLFVPWMKCQEQIGAEVKKEFGVSDHFKRGPWGHETEASFPQELRRRRLNFFYGPLIGIVLWTTASCASPFWPPLPADEPPHKVDPSVSSLLDPNPEDVPFFEAIGEEQDKQLQRCHHDEECSSTLFLRGVAALYVNQELAAQHFRRVVAANPNSQLASESRFWLWVLEVLKSPENPSPTSGELAKRFAREMVERELMVHELVSKLDNSSVEALQEDLNHRDQKIEELNLLIIGLTKQVDQLKKEVAVRQGLQQELKAREKKVQELMSQLEALRRIDQELKEKTLPTRPSDKMTPSPEMETETKEEIKKTNGG